MRIQSFLFTPWLIGVAVFSWFGHAAEMANKSPDIIVILADEVGWGD